MPFRKPDQHAWLTSAEPEPPVVVRISPALLAGLVISGLLFGPTASMWARSPQVVLLLLAMFVVSVVAFSAIGHSGLPVTVRRALRVAAALLAGATVCGWLLFAWSLNHPDVLRWQLRSVVLWLFGAGLVYVLVQSWFSGGSRRRR